MDLADRRCTPCRGGAPPLAGDELRRLQDQLPGWRVIDEHHLEKSWLFPDFKSGLEFVNRIGALAEEQGHHPDLFLSWGQVKVQIFTHKAKGLTESDFVLGAKIDRLGVSPPRRSGTSGSASPEP
jgi:4a-hydroxytetrahydrobiopterin dehydratase